MALALALANGRIVADSGEGYESYAAPRQAAERVAGAQVRMPTQLVRRARQVAPTVSTASPGLAARLAATRANR